MFNTYRKLKESGYFGLYRGHVIDNNDPLKSGRCKINIFGLYDGVAEAELPWANACFPIGGAPGYGSCYIPTIGSIVYVMFEAGQIYSPIYIGGSPIQGMVPGECNTPNKYMVIKTPAGGKIYISDGDDGGIHLESPGGCGIYLDDVTGRIRLRDKAGSYIEMADGDIIIQARGMIHLNPGGITKTSHVKIGETFQKDLGWEFEDLDLKTQLTSHLEEGLFGIKDQYPPITLDGLKPEADRIIVAAIKTFPEAPVVTSTTGDVHMVGSKHYTGEAVDFRIPGGDRKATIRKLKSELGEDYDIVDEIDHFHVEYDPDKTKHKVSCVG